MFNLSASSGILASPMYGSFHQETSCNIYNCDLFLIIFHHMYDKRSPFKMFNVWNYDTLLKELVDLSCVLCIEHDVVVGS